MTARIHLTFDDLMRRKADARGFSFLPRQPVGSLLAGRHASRLRGRGLAFEELRQYHQGDDIRSMDWKATARLRSPHVRVYNEERERPVLFLVDQRPAMFFGSRHAMKSVVAGDLAALGGWRALEVGDRVGGIVFNEQEIVEIRPHRSQSRLLRLFSEIVRLNELLGASDDATGPIGLNDALSRASSLARHDHLIVIVSDLNGANDETRRLATEIVQHNDVLIAVVYDPLGIQLSGAPGMVASQNDRTWQIPMGTTFAQRFQDVFSHRLQQWRTIFQALKIPLMPITTHRPTVDQVRELLGQRPR